MKIDFNQVYLGLDRKTPMKEDGKELTLKDVAIGALLMPNQHDDFKKKMEKYKLYEKIMDAEKDNQTIDVSTIDGPEEHIYLHYFVDLISEEILLIKNLIGEIQPPIIVGQTVRMLGEDGAK
jgi:hypothetical protein